MARERMTDTLEEGDLPDAEKTQLAIARKFRLYHHPRGMPGVQSLRGPRDSDFPADCPRRTHFHPIG
jgi:hypothetical protein